MEGISVIVCTYNRAESLKDTLQSLTTQRFQGFESEILIVDNNSSDHTKQTVEEFGKNNPLIRYLFEPRQGISYARNRGIAEAKGEILAFADDDVVISSDWIQAIWNCFHETEAMAMAGKIERLWHGPKPEWLAEEVTGPLIVQDLGSERLRWKFATRHMVGANMAFRRVVFNQLGGFAEELGRRGDSLLGGEDRDLFLRLWHRNIPIYYEPAAIVGHKVEENRLSKTYMRTWFWEIGKTLGHEMEWKSNYAFTVAPLWLWKDWASALVRRIKALLLNSRETEKFASEMWLRHYSGMLAECLTHWLPFGWGRKWCAFEKGKKSEVRSTK